MKISKTYKPELIASKDDERHTLTDPYLDAAEEKVVACNGFALVALPVETTKGERSRYISRSLLKAARSLGLKENPAEIEEDEIKPFGVFWPAEQMGREFPKWKEIVPGFKRGDKGTVTVCLDAMLLRNLARAMASSGVALTVKLGGKDAKESPILVEPDRGGAGEVGVLMPLRDDSETQLDPSQICPVCQRLLAAGAPCPQHGSPSPTKADDQPEPAKKKPATKKAKKGAAV